jgi:hypothetical protein
MIVKLAAAMLLILAACAPIAPSHAPNLSDAGTGKIASAKVAVVGTNESQGGRILVGALAGGLTGAVMASGTERDLGQAKLFHYVVVGKDGASLSFNSFSAAAAGDCVKMTRIGAKAELVLERTDSAACED